MFGGQRREDCDEQCEGGSEGEEAEGQIESLLGFGPWVLRPNGTYGFVLRVVVACQKQEGDVDLIISNGVDSLRFLSDVTFNRNPECTLDRWSSIS